MNGKRKMKQLDLFSAASKTAMEVDASDLSIFDNDIIIDDEITVREPELKPQEVTIKVGQYVRTRQQEIYRIDGISHAQSVFVGFETRKDRKGNAYQKDIYKSRERAYAYVIKGGKQIKTLICQEDILVQSPFIIDLVFKGDYIYTIDNGIQRIEHKHIGKIIQQEIYEWDKTIQNMRKRLVSYPKTYVICDGKLILHENDIMGLVSQKLDYSRYLDIGAQVRSEYWGWCTVEKVMSGKVLCSSTRTNRPVFIYFDQILEVKDIT